MTCSAIGGILIYKIKGGGGNVAVITPLHQNDLEIESLQGDKTLVIRTVISTVIQYH